MVIETQFALIRIEQSMTRFSGGKNEFANMDNLWDHRWLDR
jgi:hypothetical protein